MSVFNVYVNAVASVLSKFFIRCFLSKYFALTICKRTTHDSECSGFRKCFLASVHFNVTFANNLGGNDRVLALSCNILYANESVVCLDSVRKNIVNVNLIDNANLSAIDCQLRLLGLAYSVRAEDKVNVRWQSIFDNRNRSAQSNGTAAVDVRLRNYYSVLAGNVDILEVDSITAVRTKNAVAPSYAISVEAVKFAFLLALNGDRHTVGIALAEVAVVRNAHSVIDRQSVFLDRNTAVHCSHTIVMQANGGVNTVFSNIAETYAASGTVNLFAIGSVSNAVLVQNVLIADLRTIKHEFNAAFILTVVSVHVFKAVHNSLRNINLVVGIHQNLADIVSVEQRRSYHCVRSCIGSFQQIQRRTRALNRTIHVLIVHVYSVVDICLRRFERQDIAGVALILNGCIRKNFLNSRNTHNSQINRICHVYSFRRQSCIVSCYRVSLSGRAGRHFHACPSNVRILILGQNRRAVRALVQNVCNSDLRTHNPNVDTVSVFAIVSRGNADCLRINLIKNYDVVRQHNRATVFVGNNNGYRRTARNALHCIGVETVVGRYLNTIHVELIGVGSVGSNRHSYVRSLNNRISRRESQRSRRILVNPESCLLRIRASAYSILVLECVFVVIIATGSRFIKVERQRLSKFAKFAEGCTAAV